MAIIQWRPFRDITHWESLPTIETIQEEMNRLFHQLSPSGNGDSELMAFMPSAELEDTPDAVHLKLEIPGLEAKDLDIQVSEHSVSISGERRSETKTEEKGAVRSEFRYGKFERIIPLPVQVKTDAAQAEYKNGILTLNLPKSEQEKKKVVKVEVK
ncbi:Hsp20/alpha crystallin family protein [Chamaesiphon sp. OTE_8_metabat_110]|uniref:Hsp20/alpha crystallin family protein n=2 Tax=unclassified Chamaesiphon TaxID=2620921 RepID=UPI00286B8F01|nr:Hsp20/alpha crystallin family protein [Chamaesiphon sp. OTE_8_metabat_110]